MQHFTPYSQFKIKRKTPPPQKKPLTHPYQTQGERLQTPTPRVFCSFKKFLSYSSHSVNVVFIMRLSNICCIWEIKEDKAVWKSVCEWGGSPVQITPPNCLTSFSVIRFHYSVHNVISCVEEGYKSK